MFSTCSKYEHWIVTIDIITDKTQQVIDDITEYAVAATDEATVRLLLEVANYIDPNVSIYEETSKQQIFSKMKIDPNIFYKEWKE